MLRRTRRRISSCPPGRRGVAPACRAPLRPRVSRTRRCRPSRRADPCLNIRPRPVLRAPVERQTLRRAVHLPALASRVPPEHPAAPGALTRRRLPRLTRPPPSLRHDPLAPLRAIQLPQRPYDRPRTASRAHFFSHGATTTVRWEAGSGCPPGSGTKKMRAEPPRRSRGWRSRGVPRLVAGGADAAGLDEAVAAWASGAGDECGHRFRLPSRRAGSRSGCCGRRPGPCRWALAV
jgi:hypothetical protein